MNENQIKQADPYVHPVRASFSLESGFLVGFLLSSLGAVISLILVSWKRVLYLHAIDTFGQDSNLIDSFHVSYDLAKPWAISFCFLTIVFFGLGLFFHFQKKKSH